MATREAEEDDMADKAKEGKLTRMSRLASLLVRIRFLALDTTEGQEARFSLCSRRGLACLFAYYLFSILLNFLYLLSLHFASKTSSQFNTALESVDSTDLMSSISFNLCTFLTMPALPLILSRGAAMVPGVALSPNLPWPSTVGSGEKQAQN